MKIGFIGGGTMGEAILSVLLDKNMATAGDISVKGRTETRLEYLKEKYGVSVTNDYSAAMMDKDVIILSTKPYDVNEVMDGLRGKVKPGQLVLSILAGITIDTLKQGLEHSAIVRVMPNTPAQVGEGMSVWTSTAEVNDKQKAYVKTILGAIGKEIYVDDEKYLDMVTAVSGSGPAYFFLFVEALEQAARQIGLSSAVAHELVIQTLNGSGKLLRETRIEPAELRRLVTTPDGTTASALTVLGEGDFNSLGIRAVEAAYKRSVELGSS
jgi:pyrroline-5-carboxylate reductase